MKLIYYKWEKLKNIFVIPIFLSIILSSLSAQNSYIRVDSVQNSGLLFNITYELKEYGYKVYTTQKDDWYTVYTGPFKNSVEVNNALSKIKKNISKDAMPLNISFQKNKNVVISSINQKVIRV